MFICRFASECLCRLWRLEFGLEASGASFHLLSCRRPTSSATAACDLRGTGGSVCGGAATAATTDALTQPAASSSWVVGNFLVGDSSGNVAWVQATQTDENNKNDSRSELQTRYQVRSAVNNASSSSSSKTKLIFN
eukprot:GHVT01064782.1.p2 GENE.GHVT01064782.1~~GHVT01064782.1.p2  ORF type:complete len:136 (+),score=28.92 GHVT01064782.1:1705-2112(+)